MNPLPTLKVFHGKAVLCENVEPTPQLTKASLKYLKCNI